MMKKNLFITGSSGFIGGNLIKRLNVQDYGNVFCLSRRDVDERTHEYLPENISFIKGDLLEPETYGRYLAGCDVVIHLAALTGKAAKEEYFRVNTEGTRVLSEQCRGNNIKKFIFISSIAADFRDIEGYHYALSKIEAEGIVRNSGLPFTILRPTMVTGKGSPIVESLSKLAKLPLVPVFDGGRAVIQPVFIDDLTTCILDVIAGDSFPDRTVTVAGPERTTMAEFIKNIHDRSYQKRFRMISIPARPVAKVLLMLEGLLLPLLPFTAGQLASFTNDGIGEVPNCHDDRSRLKNIDEMLKLSLPREDLLHTDMPDLEKECVNFTNYLIACGPDAYIQSRYIRGHKITGMDRNAGPFDMFLVKAANRGRFFTRLADTYTSVFYKKALLRKKLLLLLAVLESCGRTYVRIDTVTERSAAALYSKTVLRAAVFVLNVFISFMVFGTIKLLVFRSPGTTNSALSHG